MWSPPTTACAVAARSEADRTRVTWGSDARRATQGKEVRGDWGVEGGGSASALVAVVVAGGGEGGLVVGGCGATVALLMHISSTRPHTCCRCRRRRPGRHPRPVAVRPVRDSSRRRRRCCFRGRCVAVCDSCCHCQPAAAAAQGGGQHQESDRSGARGRGTVWGVALPPAACVWTSRGCGGGSVCVHTLTHGPTKGAKPAVGQRSNTQNGGCRLPDRDLTHHSSPSVCFTEAHPPRFPLPRWPPPAPSPCSPCWWLRPPRRPPPRRRLAPSRLPPHPKPAKARSRASSARPATSLSTPTAVTSFHLGGTVSEVDGVGRRDERANAWTLRRGGRKNRVRAGRERARARVPRVPLPPPRPHSTPTTNPGSTRCVRRDAVGDRKARGRGGRRSDVWRPRKLANHPKNGGAHLRRCQGGVGSGWLAGGRAFPRAVLLGCCGCPLGADSGLERAGEAGRGGSKNWAPHVAPLRCSPLCARAQAAAAPPPSPPPQHSDTRHSPNHLFPHPSNPHQPGSPSCAKPLRSPATPPPAPPSTAWARTRSPKCSTRRVTRASTLCACLATVRKPPSCCKPPPAATTRKSSKAWTTSSPSPAPAASASCLCPSTCGCRRTWVTGLGLMWNGRACPCRNPTSFGPTVRSRAW